VENLAMGDNGEAINSWRGGRKTICYSSGEGCCKPNQEGGIRPRYRGHKTRQKPIFSEERKRGVYLQMTPQSSSATQIRGKTPFLLQGGVSPQ